MNILHHLWEQVKKAWQRVKAQFAFTPLEDAIYRFLDYTALGPLRTSTPEEILAWFHHGELLIANVKGLCYAAMMRNQEIKYEATGAPKIPREQWGNFLTALYMVTALEHLWFKDEKFGVKFRDLKKLVRAGF